MKKKLTREHIEWWIKGTHHQAYKILGSRLNDSGVRFAVWAPNATAVSVVGDFNAWDVQQHPMQKNQQTGIWSISVSGANTGDFYKYAIKPSEEEDFFLKADPYAAYFESSPHNASVIHEVDDYSWQDDEWMQNRRANQAADQPVSIYEMHPASWKRRRDGSYLTYRELAAELIPYVSEMGFTHIELMPITEYPYDPSWGYQVTGFFAPTSRFGEPKDFMFFVDECHKAGLGVLMDWVPAHFPKDDQGLHFFDGSPLYEPEHPLRREHKDWGTHTFDYGKAGVRNFLLSSAAWWCEKYHIDGFRLDAVASMLYLDYSKEEGEWLPNEQGGNENFEAIDFLKTLNQKLHSKFPGVLTFAEESTAWPRVTNTAENGGLGFDYKWNMGWMNDTLQFIKMNARQRSQNYEKITFPLSYAFNEKFVLPLSHDEVVHLKKPLLKKAPTAKSDQYANLRLLFTYMFGHPGKKLVFMGNEFAQNREWSESRSLDWHLLLREEHLGIQKLLKDLLYLYRKYSVLYKNEFSDQCFQWVTTDDQSESVFSFLRQEEKGSQKLCFALNFSDRLIKNYRPTGLELSPDSVIFNSDSTYYGGGNISTVQTCGMSPEIKLAPFSGLILNVPSEH